MFLFCFFSHFEVVVEAEYWTIRRLCEKRRKKFANNRICEKLKLSENHWTGRITNSNRITKVSKFFVIWRKCFVRNHISNWEMGDGIGDGSNFMLEKNQNALERSRNTPSTVLCGSHEPCGERTIIDAWISESLTLLNCSSFYFQKLNEKTEKYTCLILKNNGRDGDMSLGSCCVQLNIFGYQRARNLFFFS